MTTITADPTKLPWGPERVEITPHHLSINSVYSSGMIHNVHLIENDDLSVILGRGQADGQCDKVPNDPMDTGLVIVSLGVTGGDHDEVHYSGDGATVEVLTQAIETLVMCRDALRRVAKS